MSTDLHICETYATALLELVIVMGALYHPSWYVRLYTG
jgi:hypothetical protein